MFSTYIKIGACYHAHAQNADKEKAIRESIRLSHDIVNWKQGARFRVIIENPCGKITARTINLD